jgi:hypothetical protein
MYYRAQGSLDTLIKGDVQLNNVLVTRHKIAEKAPAAKLTC